jgi:hypothetical protein
VNLGTPKWGGRNTAVQRHLPKQLGLNQDHDTRAFWTEGLGPGNRAGCLERSALPGRWLRKGDRRGGGGQAAADSSRQAGEARAGARQGRVEKRVEEFESERV